MAELVGQSADLAPTLRVYDGDEVDRYVLELHSQIDRLTAEVADLTLQLAATPSLEDLEAAERALGRALLQAQLTAERGSDEEIADRVHRNAEATQRQLDEHRAHLLAEQARVLAAAEAEATAIIGRAEQTAWKIVAQAQVQAEAPSHPSRSTDHPAMPAPAWRPSPPTHPANGSRRHTEYSEHHDAAPDATFAAPSYLVEASEPLPASPAASPTAAAPAASPTASPVEESPLVLPPPSGPPVIRLNGNSGPADGQTGRRFRRRGSPR